MDGQLVSSIGSGLIIFLGIREGDSGANADLLVRKIINLRIFPDDAGRMNRSARDSDAELLIVSQFTLYADVKRGNRPSYTAAARPETAKPLYDYFVEACRHTGLRVAAGVFQAHMEVSLVNDGPVTLLCCSEP